MNAAPADRPEPLAAADISADGNSEPGAVSQSSPDDNPRSPVLGADGALDDPPGEPDDEEYVPLDAEI